MSGKTYATNKELGLNNHGVIPQHRHSGTIPASAPGSRHYIINNGGSIRVTKGQTGWRFRCEQVGTHGGYEFTVGSTCRTVMAGEIKAFDFTIDQALLLRIEQIGMVSGWGAIVATRLR